MHAYITDAQIMIVLSVHTSDSCPGCYGVPQARLADDDKAVLAQVARAIREVHKLCLKDGTPPLIMGVEGHTNCKDPDRRSNPFNMRLSAARAAACREYVESAGTPASLTRIIVTLA